MFHGLIDTTDKCKTERDRNRNRREEEDHIDCCQKSRGSFLSISRSRGQNTRDDFPRDHSLRRSMWRHVTRRNSHHSFNASTFSTLLDHRQHQRSSVLVSYLASRPSASHRASTYLIYKVLWTCLVSLFATDPPMSSRILFPLFCSPSLRNWAGGR
jgi:hypothetical protein